MATRITETRNPVSAEIDRLNTQQILEVINEEDRRVAGAVREEIPWITEAVDKIYERISRGGRLYYVGSGTSGRLGILDAVECVPTFSVARDRVTGIIAGGREAMFAAQEEIEDNPGMGRQEMRHYQVGEPDCVVGIAASGNTPYVLGAIDEARRRGALTIALTNNHQSRLGEIADISINPVVGPEVITGSTRMKAGTAQKLVLNMISTTVMIKLGKVYSNLMVDLQPTNKKLVERAKNIFMKITDADYQQATAYLEKAGFRVKEAIIMYCKGCSQEKARALLAENQHILRQVIG